MIELEYYSFFLVTNGTDFAGKVKFLPVGTTMVNLSFVFPGIDRYTNYSLNISAGNSFGDGKFTEPVSIGKANLHSTYSTIHSTCSSYFSGQVCEFEGTYHCL